MRFGKDSAGNFRGSIDGSCGGGGRHNFMFFIWDGTGRITDPLKIGYGKEPFDALVNHFGVRQVSAGTKPTVKEGQRGYKVGENDKLEPYTWLDGIVVGEDQRFGQWLVNLRGNTDDMISIHTEQEIKDCGENRAPTAASGDVDADQTAPTQAIAKADEPSETDVVEGLAKLKTVRSPSSPEMDKASSVPDLRGSERRSRDLKHMLSRLAGPFLDLF